MIDNFSHAEKIINYTFKNKKLLKICFTHSSYAYENNCESNERLEFLGDKVLDLVIAEDLFTKYKDKSSGFLTAEKQKIVSKKPLCEAVIKLNLERFLLLSKGEKNQQLSQKTYSDIFEALVAGIYLDGGYKEAKKFILNNITKTNFESSSISNFQELVQKQKLGEIKYNLIEKNGSDHQPEFKMELTVNGEKISSGTGHSKQEAKAMAAKNALEIINSDN